MAKILIAFVFISVLLLPIIFIGNLNEAEGPENQVAENNESEISNEPPAMPITEPSVNDTFSSNESDYPEEEISDSD
jgi:hypothetical protein